MTDIVEAFSKSIRSIEAQFGCKFRMMAILESCPEENQVPMANHLDLLFTQMRIDRLAAPDDEVPVE